MNLSALAHWESAVLASIVGASGTIDERDAQITRSGMYAEYPAIFRSYVELARDSADPAIALEALKRAVFVAWASFGALPVDTGITELPETEVRELMGQLDADLAAGRADDELRFMLAWYRDAFGYVFDHFGPVRSLDAFIRDISSEDVRRRGADVIGGGERGQMGRYWAGLLVRR
ncbi:MAG TPA: hypothetical protein VN706_08640 [Gemmatimonadaceae bacterium]|nr:hypothetical protein [Gemmatimonadaceae bacterium]